MKKAAKEPTRDDLLFLIREQDKQIRMLQRDALFNAELEHLREFRRWINAHGFLALQPGAAAAPEGMTLWARAQTALDRITTDSAGLPPKLARLQARRLRRTRGRG